MDWLRLSWFRWLSLLCLAKSDSMIKSFELKTLTKETRTAAKCLKSTLDVVHELTVHLFAVCDPVFCSPFAAEGLFFCLKLSWKKIFPPDPKLRLQV